MSELLSAAAAALGTPEALVKRAAEARAQATGTTVDEVLTAWAGGGAIAPSPASPPAETASDEAAPETPATAEQPPAAAAPELPAATEPAMAPPPAPTGRYQPPVLVGAGDNPTRVLAGAIGMFLLVLLIGFVGPSLPSDNPGERSSALPFSEAAMDGRHVYMKLGCASCHTQMVRPIVADVGLGPVTLNDTNQVLGIRRFGPDLSNVGSRTAADDMDWLVRGGGGHPSHNLSSTDMASLIAYLSESSTSGDG
jgi:cytochrome c oxidase cbb3-type subunit II